MAADPKRQMKIYEQAPTSELRPFIKRFLVVQFPQVDRDTHLPNLGPVAAFTFRGRCRLDGLQWAPAAALTGIRQSLRVHEHLDKHAVLLVIFEATGASAFLSPPLEEFSGATVDLTGVLAPRGELDQLQERIAAAPNHRRRVILLEDFLLNRLRATMPDQLVSAAVKWIDHEPGAKRIEELTQYIGLSQSALERRFRRVVGLSPKKFASVVRLHQAVQLTSTGMDFASVAATAGYFDQAHFINDFRRATGSPPTVFFRSRSAD
jgi:AraC-like DNA-binding protein